MSNNLNFGTPLENASSAGRNLSPSQKYWDRRNQLIETHSEHKARV